MNKVNQLLGNIRNVYAQHSICVCFIAMAVFVRLFFWIYTGRVWEDAVITLVPVKNFWLGNGLTHHLTEPRVHSFTSPISMLIPLLGESIHQGLFLLRLTAVLAGAWSIYYAYRVGQFLKFHWAAQILLLSYLAFDQLQVFFGMTGMETQVATAIFLGNVYYLFKEKWLLLGVFSGLGLLARPEFAIWLPLLGIYMIIFHREGILSFLLAFLCMSLPWYIFAHLYYGSIIPNTIIAKSSIVYFGNSLKDHLIASSCYFIDSWKNIAPFLEWRFLRRMPIPYVLAELAAFGVLIFALLGVRRAFKEKEWRLLALFSILMIFVIYRSLFLINPYYMWYLPPFAALLFLIAAYGLSSIVQKSKLYVVLSFFIVLMYAIHMPFSFAVEKQVQKKVECGARLKTGVILNSMMGESDTVVLEPLGYIGYGAFNKTTYDFPGLSSKVVVNTMRTMKSRGLVDLIAKLKPSFIVLRPIEHGALQFFYPEVAKNYKSVAHIRAQDDQSLAKWGYSSKDNLYSDGDFSIYQRIFPQTELGSEISFTKNIDHKTYEFCRDL